LRATKGLQLLHTSLEVGLYHFVSTCDLQNYQECEEKGKFLRSKLFFLKKRKRKNHHAVAGVLKLYFTQLPDALLTWKLYECFLAAIGKSKEFSDLF
jgi:hypothetical protein